MAGRAALLLLGLASCASGGTTGYDVTRPTPVQLPFNILTTDPSNPLTFDKNVDAQYLTTMYEVEPSADGLVKPSPMLTGFQTTGIALPLMVGNVPVSNQLTTRPIAVEPNGNLLLKPTPAVTPSKQFQTDAANPSFHNVPVLAKMTTQIAEPDPLKPTSVTDATPALQTRPITVAVMSEPAPDAAPSTGSLIEPSQVSNINPGSVLPDVGTPNLKPEEQNKIPSDELDVQVGLDIAPCVCSSYKEINPTPIGDLVSHVVGNGLQPQLFTPEGSKWNNVQHTPNNVYQQIFIAQLNFFINNMHDVIAANVPAYY